MKRRILLLITDLGIGGTPTVVRELAIRLHQPDQVEVEVACLGGWGSVAEQLSAAGISVTALNARGVGSLPITVYRLVRLIRRGRFHTVFSFLVHANAVAAAAGMWCRGVCYIQSIQTTQPGPRWHWALQELASRVATWIVVPSPSVAAAAVEWASISRDRILVVPNAVDTGAFPASPAGTSNPRPYPIGFIGRLDAVKRIPDLLAAVSESGGLVELHVFGEGRERATVEAEICRLNIGPMVRMHGAVTQPQTALEQIGLLVLPSAAEGFGLVLIEAMAAGVPVVATDVPGIRDVVRDGITGLLVPPGRPRELAAAIRRVVEDETLRRRLIDTASVDVREHYNWDKVIVQYQRLLSLE